MGKNISVVFGDNFEDFVSSKIQSGRFSNASEIIRAGLSASYNSKFQVK